VSEILIELLKNSVKTPGRQGAFVLSFVRKTPGTTNSCVDLSPLLFLPLSKNKLFIYGRLD